MVAIHLRIQQTSFQLILEVQVKELAGLQTSTPMRKWARQMCCLGLRWMIDYAATTAGDSYTMTDVSIWLYENGANTVFPSTAIPDLAANGAVNVFQGDLVFTPPAQSVPNHCEADVQFSTHLCIQTAIH